jgi:Protein of unknown function DUF262/Protein of unknown function (DUF1524)
MAAAIKFEPMGIGDLIRRGRLVVPPNQRSYAWEERNVIELLQDLNAAMTSNSSGGTQEYFLGTIVLVDPEDGKPPQISDGQQRIATTAIIFARIRDLFKELQQDARATSVHQDYVSKIDLDTAEDKPQVSLNTEDNAFFASTILANYPHKIDETKFIRSSNRRLLVASRVARDYLSAHIGGFAENGRAAQLARWVRFIKERTHMIAVTVLDENQAFRLFETLNDRGVKASQVDILKNFFLEQSADRKVEAHMEWTELTGKIEANFPDNDDQMLLYVRHLWITQNGHTTEKELSTKIRSKITAETLAVNFISEANKASLDYIALFEPSHPKWNAYKNTTREYLNTINKHLKVEQIRPLLFAIARHFDPEEANKAFRFAVSMSVRFLIYGGRGGFLDEHYAARAHLIGAGKITKAKELRESLKGELPTDSQFEQAFSTARVSKAYLARYYLRALDKTIGDDPTPEFVANEDYEAANLEHIIPVKPSSAWKISEDDAASAQQMIGNLTLLSAKKNVGIANEGFVEKLNIYKGSDYAITNQLQKYGVEFGIEQVKERQIELAKLASKTWSFKFD